MIDGAHVLTPGVLHFGLKGLATYEPAIVVTQQWYVGPGQQGDAMDNGYNEEYEDKLFDEIRWPNVGHRLFEIGHFVGDRDWLDGVWESNCIFAPRTLLAQVGGFDESFSTAGGGYANLELYERLGTSTDITVCTIMGEGSFHQTHGGTTTNQADAATRRSRVFGYSRDYAQLRGRAFKGPGKPLHYVGRLPNAAARRSKPRRLSAPDAFAASAAAGVHDGVPAEPMPVPDDLRLGFTEAVWRSLPWRRTSWLGHPLSTAPTDLVAYQEAIAAVRPDWVIETGTGDGARALLLASICELVGHGEVITVAESMGTEGDRPQHPRLRYLSGVPHNADTIAAIRETIRDESVLVILGSCADRATTAREFEAFSPLVPVGSYVIVTDTIVNGHPVWPSFGPGPAEGVKQVLTKYGEFVADPTLEKYSLTFNPGGYLKRVS
jgi:cephalosporin hydroxylase